MNDRLADLARQIESMEQRVLNASTIEAARHFHDRLDLLRVKREAVLLNEARRLVESGRG